MKDFRKFDKLLFYHNLIITSICIFGSSSSSFSCNYYSVSNTNSATQNYAICSFALCSGATVTINGGCSCSGDQYLRLYDSSGNNVASNDDSCGIGCSQIVYLTSGSCQTYEIHEGCYQSNSCSGTVSVVSSTSFYSTSIPTDTPTDIPTATPALTFSPSITLSCSLYKFDGITNPSYDATLKYNNCYFVLPPVNSPYIYNTVTLSTGCSCTGDTFLRLFDPMGIEIMNNDNSCGLCSTISFTPTFLTYNSGVFTIRAGCSAKLSCAGQVTIVGLQIGYSNPPTIEPSFTPSVSPTMIPSKLPTYKPTKLPSYIPTMKPTKLPTMKPSFTPTAQPTKLPTFRPSFSPTLGVLIAPQYSASNTNDVTINYKTFCFSACGDQTIVADTGCSCVGSPVLKLYQRFPLSLLATSAVSCNTCSQLSYFINRLNSVCNDFCIYEGCAGNSDCAANVTVSGVVIPSVYPTSHPSLKPSHTPTPSPSIKPTLQPSFQSSFQPSKLPTVIPSTGPTFETTTSPTRPTYEPSLPPTSIPISSSLPKHSVSPTLAATIVKKYAPTLVPTSSINNNDTTQSSPIDSIKTDKSDIGIAVGVTIGVVFVVLLISFLLWKYRTKWQIYIFNETEDPIIIIQPTAPPAEEDFSTFVLNIERSKNIEIELSVIKYFTKNFFNKIGEGKFGKVYKMDIPCRYNNNSNPPINKSFAVKQFIDDVNGGNIVPGIVSLNRETLYKEIKILSSFEHPNIIKLIGFSLREQVLSCLIYEYGERGDLLKCLRDDATSLEMTCLVRIRIAIGIIIGLSYLHNHKPKQPALHRDIKSSNIVIMKDFTAKIIDCGLAKYNSSDDDVKVFNRKSVGPSTANQNSRVGTPGYTCPRYMMYHNNYNISSEIYSVGIVFLELLSGLIQHSQINNTSESVILETMEMGSFSFDGRIPLSSNETEVNLLKLSRSCVEYEIFRRPKDTRDILRILRKVEKDFIETNNYIFENLEKELAEQRKLNEENLKRQREREEKENASRRECYVCFDIFGPDARVDCSNNTHFLCKGCFSNQVLVQVGYDKRGDFRNYKSKIVCSCCFSPFPDVDVAKGSIEAFAAYLKACFEEIEYSVEARYNKRIEDLKKAVNTANNTRMENIHRHRLFIAENILTIKCPRCKGAFIINFDHCLALTCTCNCAFCAWCSHDCGNDAHAHVRNCPHNAEENGNLFSSEEKFNTAQGEKRKREIIQYINQNLIEERDKRDLKELMRRDLQDLNIVL